MQLQHKLAGKEDNFSFCTFYNTTTKYTLNPSPHLTEMEASLLSHHWGNKETNVLHHCRGRRNLPGDRTRCFNWICQKVKFFWYISDLLSLQLRDKKSYPQPGMQRLQKLGTSPVLPSCCLSQFTVGSLTNTPTITLGKPQNCAAILLQNSTRHFINNMKLHSWINLLRNYFWNPRLSATCITLANLERHLFTMLVVICLHTLQIHAK